MAVTSGSVSVQTNAATLIVAAANANANAVAFVKGSVQVTLTNLSVNTCYIGPVGVTSAGFRLLPQGNVGSTITFPIGLTDTVYGLAAGGNALVGYLVTG